MAFFFKGIFFFFFKHVKKKISEPQRNLIFNLCVICIAGSFQIYIFWGEPQDRTAG